jgi:hypothetical protein
MNALWPWGQGFRPQLPNLAMRRGDVAFVESGSMRLEGLCQLVGYVHGERGAFSRGLRTDFRVFAATVARRRVSLALVESVAEMQRHHRPDMVAHSLASLSEEVVGPLLDGEEPFELRIAAPGGQASVSGPPPSDPAIGLGLEYLSIVLRENGVPFDERVPDDAKVPMLHTWEFLRPGLAGTD